MSLLLALWLLGTDKEFTKSCEVVTTKRDIIHVDDERGYHREGATYRLHRCGTTSFFCIIDLDDYATGMWCQRVGWTEKPAK